MKNSILWFMYKFKYCKYIHMIHTYIYIYNEYHILTFARWVKSIQTIHEYRFPSPASSARSTGSRPPELHRLLQDSTGICTHCGCGCGVVLRVQPLISQKIWSVDFECLDKCMVLRWFIMFSCPEVSAWIFQKRLPGATGVLPRFGSFRSQSGCAFESTILPPCVRELMWLVRTGAIWIDVGSVACGCFRK